MQNTGPTDSQKNQPENKSGQGPPEIDVVADGRDVFVNHDDEAEFLARNQIEQTHNEDDLISPEEFKCRAVARVKHLQTRLNGNIFCLADALPRRFNGTVMRLLDALSARTAQEDRLPFTPTKDGVLDSAKYADHMLDWLARIILLWGRFAQEEWNVERDVWDQLDAFDQALGGKYEIVQTVPGVDLYRMEATEGPGNARKMSEEGPEANDSALGEQDAVDTSGNSTVPDRSDGDTGGRTEN